ncbi:hypothetical protein SAMN02745216_03829 [Desulfatibacillum alkenivorans DSM 16219]|jgi:hypothetical protein|uniref:Uncharacterized protein n=1 Tax=Desulfatibacillum alkenivorans DSM 16219 TaxID=1121393 RepID=A0A1M6U675_9BACT|nr:hypothetical protein [Desulfatibacillum alkenivorans]SHK64670.1 hypothetical protein SAMN02745216_03829 [Desulfatibacillum alkenivorans DSM 16219]
MYEVSEAHKARYAIHQFKVITDSLAIRGFYRPSGKFGKALENCLRSLSPEIYGSLNDPRVVELKGLEYVIDRLPRGIEECTRVILTEEDPFKDSPFERIEPFKRRRTSYRISDKEICFVISRGLSEIYDILTHMTFLNMEAAKIHSKMRDDSGNITVEWAELEKVALRKEPVSRDKVDQALWNLSIILGRSYGETKATYEYLEKTKVEYKANNGLFSLVYRLGKRIDEESSSRENMLVIYLTPSLMNIIGHQKYGRQWGADIKEKLVELGLKDRPLHIVSANLHSVVNTLYGYAAVKEVHPDVAALDDVYAFFDALKAHGDDVLAFAEKNGVHPMPDQSGSHIDCQIIDTAPLKCVEVHPGLDIETCTQDANPPVILVMDYAFGAQAFELMENLLKPLKKDNGEIRFDIRSVSIMGKAGILTGKQGDIMLATAHVFEGTSDNYNFRNDMVPEDFNAQQHSVFVGPMVTVLGTSLQNRDVLLKLKDDWKTIGLEMEGGHYQRAISAAIIKGNIPSGTRVRYAYYASDNPLQSGQTLAAGAMGKEGVRPTYMITKVILEKIFGKPAE